MKIHPSAQCTVQCMSKVLKTTNSSIWGYPIKMSHYSQYAALSSCRRDRLQCPAGRTESRLPLVSTASDSLTWCTDCSETTSLLVPSHILGESHSHTLGESH